MVARTTTEKEGTTVNISVYVVNLHAYNCGELVGEWIDLPMDDDELRAAIQRIIDAYPGGEEIAIHDYEGPFRIREYENIYVLNEKMKEINSLSEDEQTAVVAVLKATGYDVDEALRIVKDGAYQLYYYSLIEWAYRCVDDGLFGDVPTSIQPYIDYEAIARDLRIEGYVEVNVDGRTVVIRVE